ncbi:cytochrome c3 family protein [Methylocapsa acidiphila]|uniref:cytochrome c3 family protein n=1 Tax=Methylocapsa acidiphila TaxID=133552 RepID=UPI000413114D|nr:cytochrome c3 family protein [Methylocapsa acidiphila]
MYGASAARRSIRARAGLTALAAGFALATLAFGFFARAEPQAEAPAHFVGASACASCHAAETERWKVSHHAQAMRNATPSTVLGDFNGARLEHFGVVTHFSRAGEKFIVHTDGPDSVAHDYDIAYTFGVFPLQQYLIAFPGGRYQALGVAWDSRPKAQGGQRWLHLYPDQALRAGDPLHWTGRDQTWNYQCAACHSTDLRKNYDLAANAYSTAWSDVNVGCEACHGPGSRHIAWAKEHAGPSAPSEGAPAESAVGPRMGLTTRLEDAALDQWRMNSTTGIAQRVAPATGRELEICAPCHSRRKPIAKDPSVGAAVLDGYLPALLEPGLYHADGQIDGEVFEYGSFLQSRMHHAGVACSNCHEPHGAKLRAEGNALCAQCHLPAKFDVEAHHHHAPGSASAQCVNCHMPTKTYMEVDARRDHSLRVPRPDLTLTLGAPNACAKCHADKPADWAARAVAAWFPAGRQTRPHYGEALAAGRSGAADAEQRLIELVVDRDQPAIARASALALLSLYATSASESAIKTAIADPDPLVRSAAPRALPSPPPATLVQVVAPLLGDSFRAVRIEAARALAGADHNALTPEQESAYAKAYLELYDSEMVDADRPEAHLNLGLLEIRLRHPAEAEEQYSTALRLDPNFTPALINLADLDRMRGRNESLDLLRKAMALDPRSADVRHSLGLALVRQRNYADALPQLREAHELAPDNARYAYVYAVALHSIGARDQAMTLLAETHLKRPADRNVLLALISMARESGDVATALAHARELAALDPTEAQYRDLVRALESRKAQ